LKKSVAQGKSIGSGMDDPTEKKGEGGQGWELDRGGLLRIPQMVKGGMMGRQSRG